MENDGELKQVLVEIRDLMRSAEERQRKMASVVLAMRNIVYVVVEMCLLALAVFIWLFYMTITTAPAPAS